MSDMEINSNKLAAIHVLAALIQTPSLLLDNDTYRFSIDDFPEQFHKILFGAIDYLAHNKMGKIGFLDIDEYLKQYPTQYKVFCANKGIEYIQNAVRLYDDRKFKYYYESLKKYSLINKLNSQGICTKDILDPEIIDPVQIAKMQERFDGMTIDDILLSEETKLIRMREEFGTSTDRVEKHAGDGLRALKESFKETPYYGLPLISPTLTTLFRGQRAGCLYIESAPSGTGKSRRGNSEACHLAVSEYYDAIQRKWIRTNMHESVLVISTELEESECQQMWLAFVSGVAESHIKDGRYESGEEERVDKAIDLITESDLRFVGITNYDADDIINIIKKYHSEYGVNYVYFDYLGETLKMTSSIAKQSRVQGLRTDQILLTLSSALKDTAKTLGIYIWTASQLSGDYKNAKDLDAGYLRSAKSIADKVDVGSILMPVRPAIDQPAIDSYCAKGFELRPTHVVTAYKIRAGSYQNVKVYVHFDRGTCQMTDCFTTDSNGVLLDVKQTNIEVMLDNTKAESFTEVYSTAYTGKQQQAEEFDF